MWICFCHRRFLEITFRERHGSQPPPPNSCKAQLHYSMWELMGSVSSIDLFFAQAPLRRRQHITNMCIVCWTGLNALKCVHEYRRNYIPRGVYFRMSRPHSFMLFAFIWSAPTKDRKGQGQEKCSN